MKSRFDLFIICLVGFLTHAGIGLIYPVFAIMLFDPNSTIVPIDTSNEVRGLLFGLLLAITPLGQFFSSSILGTLSDSHGRKKILQLSIIAAIIGYFSATIGIVIDSILLLILSRALIGVSEGGSAVAQAAISDVSTEETKARNFSLLNSAMGMGFTFGPLIGGVLSDPQYGSWCGHATPFIVTGFLCVFNLILITMRYPNVIKTTEHVKYNVLDGLYNLKRAFHWKGLRLYFFATFCFTFGWSFYAEFIPITLMKSFDFATAEIGQYLAYGGIWYSISAGILTAPILNRFSANKVVVKALFIAALYMPLFLMIDKSQYIWFHVPLTMYLMALVFPTMAALVSNEADEDKQGQVMGIYESVSAISFGLSPLIGGMIVANYPSMTIWIGAAAMFLSGLTIVFEQAQKDKQLANV